MSTHPSPTRLDIQIDRDPARVILKPFLPGEETFPDGQSRVEKVLRRVLAVDAAQATDALASVRARFVDRHRDFETILLEHAAQVAARVDDLGPLSRDQQLLIGAYFTHEYSIEAAALFNPSIVPAFDQSGTADGEVRVVVSLRAVGEGHISSIEFRRGTIDAQGTVRIEPAAATATTGQRRSPTFDREQFRAKLDELGVLNMVSARILDRLEPGFTMCELERAMVEAGDSTGLDEAMQAETRRIFHLMANSNYIVVFADGTDLSERVLYPSGPYESHGMEDARFVRFVDDDGSVMYYSTYTAWDGIKIIPQLIETRDFRAFRVATLNGKAVQNKGMAMFPRRINGRYAMLSRSDRENIDIMFSDHPRTWQASQQLSIPRQPWELIQIGNCGSPIETDAGWLVLTHGVGPMRTYAIGAILLDLDNPARVIGQLDEPILLPDGHERDGYVPNVVYSCGAMAHAGWLVLPYGISDMNTRIARFDLAQLLDALTI